MRLLLFRSEQSRRQQSRRRKRKRPRGNDEEAGEAVAAMDVDEGEQQQRAERRREQLEELGGADHLRGAKLLHAPEREAPALDGGGGAAKASGAVAECTGGEVGGAALDLVEVDAGAVPDDVRDVIGVEVRVPLTRICLAGRRTVALVAEGDGDAVGGGGGEGGEDGVEGGVVAGSVIGGVDIGSRGWMPETCQMGEVRETARITNRTGSLH